MELRSMSLALVAVLGLMVLQCLEHPVDAKEKDVTELQVGVKFKPKECAMKAHKGDSVKVHYRGALTDGTVFDASFDRGDPIDFKLGVGQVIKEFDSSYGRGVPFDFQLGKGSVIKGWDQGLLGACLGEKRKLKIPSKLGYGDQGSPPKIPGGATLIFDTELVGINGVTYKTPDNSEL